MGRDNKKVISEEARNELSKQFNELKHPVSLYVFTKKGEKDQFSSLVQKFTQELHEISSNIQVTFFDQTSKETDTYNIHQFPQILIQPDTYNIRYIGAPFGEESRSFLETIMLVSRRESRLSSSSKEALKNLSEKRDIKVFVTLSCPYCPGQVMNGFKTAIERPDLISASCIDASEHLTFSRKYNVGAVPHTVINEETISKGFEPEDRFIKELIDLQPVAEEHVHEQVSEDISVDLIIIGGGPAGLTAGLYAARSGLQTLIIEKNDMIGGQVSITPMVENWPGHTQIPGQKLMEMISSQVREYIPIIQGEEIEEIKVGKKIEALSSVRRYIGKAIILTTGATHKKLGIPGENDYYGKGVSYCATCDGYLYKDQEVIVAGGGNTALTDALYLHNLGAKVTIIHRKQSFRGEHYLVDSVKREQIPVLWNTEITKIAGDKMVTTVEIKHNQTEKTETINTDAVFVAIGEEPNNDLAKTIGIQIDDQGYVIIDRYGRTNIPRIYAAGDLTGGVRQIVTAVGEGASAATSAFHDIFQSQKNN